MSLLDDARRLSEKAIPFWDSPYSDSQVCAHCGEYRKHASDCPMRSLPKIVAALEAAEQFVKSQQGTGYMDAGRFHPYITYEQWYAFVAAIQGTAP